MRKEFLMDTIGQAKDTYVMEAGMEVKTKRTGKRFWKVLAAVLECPVPATVEEKRRLLLDNGIALWDVIASCEITGSADSSIRNVVPNDLRPILEQADIKTIFANGKTAEKYFRMYQEPALGRPAVCLPSTSPANASWSLERLTQAWRVIGRE